MEIDGTRASRLANFIISVVLLTVMVGGLVFLIVAATEAAGNAGVDADTRKYWGRLAYVALILLALVIVVLFWTVVHFVARRNRGRQSHAPTPYVDAWAVAGRRFRLPAERDDAEDEPHDQGEAEE